MGSPKRALTFFGAGGSFGISCLPKKSRSLSREGLTSHQSLLPQFHLDLSSQYLANALVMCPELRCSGDDLTLARACFALEGLRADFLWFDVVAVYRASCGEVPPVAKLNVLMSGVPLVELFFCWRSGGPCSECAVSPFLYGM